MKVIRFADIAPSNWDEICDASPEAWLYHRAAWIAIETAHFVRENHSFALVDSGKIIGLQPLYFSEIGLGNFSERLLHAGIHRQTGLALITDIGLPAIKAAQRAAMQQIMQLAHELNVDRIQLNSQNLAPANRSPHRLEIPFWVTADRFQLGLNFGPAGFLPVPGMTTCCADQIVDLSPPLPMLFGALEAACRRAIRKAKSSGLMLEIAEDASCITRYYALAQRSARRTGEALPPPEYYSRIWNQFSPTKRCAILFARHEERDIAALFLVLDKEAASFLAGVSDPEALTTRPNDFVHWQAITWLKLRGITCYRLGPAFPELPENWPIVQLSHFKTKFGGRSVLVIQGSLFRRPQKYLAHGLAFLQALVSCTDA